MQNADSRNHRRATRHDDRRITALLQLLAGSRSKKIPSSNEAVERQRGIATVGAIRAKRRGAHRRRESMNCSTGSLNDIESVNRSTTSLWPLPMKRQRHKLGVCSLLRRSERYSSVSLRSGLRKLSRLPRTDLPKNP